MPLIYLKKYVNLPVTHSFVQTGINLLQMLKRDTRQYLNRSPYFGTPVFIMAIPSNISHANTQKF